MEDQYRPCVGILLRNQFGLYFSGKRFFCSQGIGEGDCLWQMPQGGIDVEESPQEAALRELREETGIRTVEVLAEAVSWIYYDLPQDALPFHWGGRFVGQKQKWFLCAFLGEEREIDLLQKEQEFSQWAWRPPEKILEDVVSFKREAYRKVFKVFRIL